MPAPSFTDSRDRDTTVEYGLPGDELETVINRFVSAAALDPFTSWLIFPSQRLVVYVRDSLTLKNIPFITSRICTLEGFCKTIFEETRTTERLLSESESKMLLAKILEDLKKDPEDDVSLFVARDRPASGTIGDLRIFMNTIRMRKVAFPECLLELQSAKSDQLDTIITEYRNCLRAGNLVDDDTILEWTIDHLGRSASSPLGRVFIYGFYEPLPLEQDLFDTVRELARESYIFIPDGIDPDIFRSRAGAGKPPAFDPSSPRVAITGLFSETGTLAAKDFFHVRSFPSRSAEVYGIATEIARLNASGTPLSDIAVVFPDLHGGDYGLIDETFREFAIPWNAAVAPRLSRAPVIQFLTDIAGLAARGYAREDLVRIVGSPYFQNIAAPDETSRMNAADVDLVSRYAGIDGPHPDWERQLDGLHAVMQDPERAKNYPGISVRTVERVQEGVRALTRDLNKLSGKKSLRDHVRDLQTFLESWKIPYLYAAPDEPTKDREIQAYQKFISRLDVLATAAWIPADEFIDAQEFSRFVSALAEERDESGLLDSNGVTVIGHKECQHIRFPVVFIGGLVEGTFPRLTTRLPFTNTLENKRMGTRTLSEILREEQYYFIAALLAGQNTVYVSAPRADGEKPLLTSAFFERILMRTGDLPWPDSSGIVPPASRRTAAVRAGAAIHDNDACTARDLIPETLGISDLVERINMERYYRRGACDSFYDGILSGDASIQAALAGRYGPDHVYSPTSLETYANCPFAYFLNRVIYLEALPEVEPNLSSKDRGTAIHNVLSTFYREWRASGQTRVSLASLTDATELILRLAKTELDKYSFQSPLWDATRILMLGDTHTGPGYFERFLVSETEEADSPLVPSRFEFSFGMGTDASDDPASSPAPVELVSTGGEKVFIRGRIDRIDLTPSGNFLIYDYKSGLTHPKAKDIEAGTALQLPLYLLAFEKISGNHGIGGGYYTIRREVGRSIVLADSAAKELMVSKLRVSADFAGVIRHARDCTFAYINGIRSGQFPLPRVEKCPNEYCDFKRICRFDPYRVLETGEET